MAVPEVEDDECEPDASCDAANLRRWRPKLSWVPKVGSTPVGKKREERNERVPSLPLASMNVGTLTGSYSSPCGRIGNRGGGRLVDAPVKVELVSMPLV